MILGGRLTVGHGTLNPGMKVRLLPPQQTRDRLSRPRRVVSCVLKQRYNIGMDLESVEKFCQEKGLGIMSVLLDHYDSADFEISSREIEKEIYEVATSYSRILFFEAKIFLQESVRVEVIAHLSSRFDNKQIQKMKDIDLLAHWIKSEVIRSLEEKGISLQ